MNRLFSTVLLLVVATATMIQALPVFDAELVASPLMHEVRLNYRGARKVYQNED